MRKPQKLIIVYNNDARSSYLWMNNGCTWYMFPFLDGRDLYPFLEEKFNIEGLNFSDLPEELQSELQVDGLDIDIQRIFIL